MRELKRKRDRERKRSHERERRVKRAGENSERSWKKLQRRERKKRENKRAYAKESQFIILVFSSQIDRFENLQFRERKHSGEEHTRDSDES